MNINVWNKDTYKEFINYLKSIKEEEYKEFHKKICSTKYEILGIRLPILRNIAKEISKTNIEDFLDLINNKYYEETMIEGLVISQIKDETIFNKYFNRYIKKIDNWALCDTFCTSCKKIKKYNNYYDIAKELILSSDEFISRVGWIIIFDYFIKEEYLEEIYSLLDNNISDKYYINMAKAWLICELFIKYPQETLEYIKLNKLDKFTHNKAISKIHDSLRVDKKMKEYLNTLRK